MATKKENTAVEVVTIKPIKRERKIVRIEGDTPLIMHAWSEKAKKMMLDAQTGKKKGAAKEIRKPVEEFIDSMYWLSEMPTEKTEEGFEKAIEAGARFGFPATSFKQAAISAAYRAKWVKDKMGLRGALFIQNVDGSDMIEIKSDAPIMREDMVRIGMGTADLRYRGEFRNWSAELLVTYDANGEFSFENLINIINAGGMTVGVGEWRPERDGNFGTYHVVAE